MLTYSHLAGHVMTIDFTAACIQMNSGSDMEDNIATATRLIKTARAHGAEFIALPENVALMKESGTGYDSVAYEETDHPALQAFMLLAKQHKCILLVGSLAIKCPNTDKLANRSYLLSSEGEIIAYYDKIHLFDVELPNGETYKESKHFLHGNQAILASTPLGNIGMTICYDVRFPQLYRTLAQAGAQIITVPAAFTQATGKAHWHSLLRARAIENSCYIIAPTQYGTHPSNRKTFGHALIIDPWGEILAEASEGAEEVITAPITLVKVNETRQRLPSLLHDRGFTLGM